MIIDALKTELTTAGCTLVLYEREGLANVVADQSKINDYIGIIIEPAQVTLTVAGNGVTEQYAPILIEFLKQVRPEDLAENNKATLAALLEMAKTFVFNIIRSQLYKKLTSVQATKVNEQRYDANVIGWVLALIIQPIENKNNC